MLCRDPIRFWIWRLWLNGLRFHSSDIFDRGKDLSFLFILFPKLILTNTTSIKADYDISFFSSIVIFHTERFLAPLGSNTEKRFHRCQSWFSSAKNFGPNFRQFQLESGISIQCTESTYSLENFGLDFISFWPNSEFSKSQISPENGKKLDFQTKFQKKRTNENEDRDWLKEKVKEGNREGGHPMNLSPKELKTIKWELAIWGKLIFYFPPCYCIIGCRRWWVLDFCLRGAHNGQLKMI